MTFEARDSAAKVVPARLKLSTNTRGNGARINSSRRTTGKKLKAHTVVSSLFVFVFILLLYFSLFKVALKSFDKFCSFGWLILYYLL